MPADCIEKVARQNFASKGSPRPAPKIVLKNAWQVEHGKQSSSEQSCAEGDLFKIVLCVQGVPQTTVLEDQGKMTEIRDLVNTLRTACPTESVIADLSNPGQFNRFRDESKKTIHKVGKFELFELGEVCTKIQMCQAFEGTDAQDQGSIRSLVNSLLHREKIS